MLHRNGTNSWFLPRRNRKGNDGSHRTTKQNLYTLEFRGIYKIKLRNKHTTPTVSSLLFYKLVEQQGSILPIRTILVRQYREDIRSNARTGRSFGNSHPSDGIKSRLSLKELDNEAPRVLRHSDSSVNGAIVPTTREKIHRSRSVDTHLGTNYTTILRVGRRVNDNSIQCRAFLDVVQCDTVPGRS